MKMSSRCLESFSVSLANTIKIIFVMVDAKRIYFFGAGTAYDLSPYIFQEHVN